MCTKTRFEKEARGNLEMAYCFYSIANYACDKTGMFKTRNGDMTEWHLTMWDTVNPYNY